VPLIEKTIPYAKIYLVEEQCATTLPRLTPREVEVGRAQACLEVDFRAEKRTVTVLEIKKRVVEQEVTCLTTEPVKSCDPCTGQPCIVYQQVPVVKKVPITVSECVPVPREVVVQVPVVKPGKELVVKKLVLDATTIPAIETRLRAVPVQTEIQVQVPACLPPCPPTCPIP
jgi:hypothetical protein